MTTIEKQWISFWSSHEDDGSTGTFYGKWLFKKKLQLLREALGILPDKKLKVLDIGCGSGVTLKVFRDSGFSNLYGVDISPFAIERCEALGLIKGKNVFIGDARRMNFQTQSFGVVFEEGLWEHYTNYVPFILEMCRISSDYLIAIQPNHFSLVGAMAKIGWEIFSKNRGGVREYSIPLSYFRRTITSCGFVKVFEGFTTFKTCSCMIFRRKEKCKLGTML